MGKQTSTAFRSSRYGWLTLVCMIVLPVVVSLYSNWEAQRAAAERMKDPAYAEAKRKEEAEWKKTDLP
jgi:hypothetical protein